MKYSYIFPIKSIISFLSIILFLSFSSGYAQNISYTKLGDDPIKLYPKYNKDLKGGIYGKGKYGKALGLCGNGPIYPVVFSKMKLDEGTISLWFKPPKSIPRSFITHGLLSFGDGKQGIYFHSYKNPQKGRQIRISVSNKKFKRNWYILNELMGDEYASSFHHLLCTWNKQDISVYLDGKLISVKNRKNRETYDKWLDSFDCHSTNVSVKGFCSWIDDIFILDKYTPKSGVNDIFKSPVPWKISRNTVFYSGYEDNLIAEGIVVKNSNIIRCYPKIGVSQATFRATDPKKIIFKIVNTYSRKNLVLKGIVKDLSKKTVLNKLYQVKLDANTIADIEFDFREIKKNGLFWGYFSLIENNQVISEKNIPFAFTLCVDVANYPAGDIQTGLVISNDYNPPVYDKWDRITSDGKWISLELEPGKWYFDRLDMIVDNMLVTKRKPVIILACPPKWRLSKKKINYYCFNPDDVEGWKDYVKRVGERYKGKVYDYMFIGEAYHKVTVGVITRKEYVTMVNSAADVLHGIDPKIQVAADICDQEKFKEAIAKGTAGKMDYYIIHPYGFVNGPGKYLKDDKMILSIIETLKKYHANTTLANTEFSAYTFMQFAVHADGYPMTPEEFDKSGNWDKWPAHHRHRGREHFVDWITGSFRTVRGLVLDMAVGCKYTMWWSASPNAFGGLIYKLNAPSPMSVAYANVCGLSAGFKFHDKLDLGTNYLKGFVFKSRKKQGFLTSLFSGREDKYLISLFTDDDKPGEVYVELKDKNIKLIDQYGNDYPFERFGPIIKVILRPLIPLFVTGISTPPGESKPIIKTVFSNENLFPGVPVKLKVTMYNPLEENLSGQISLNLPKGFPEISSQKVDISSRKTEDKTFEFIIPGKITGLQPINISFKSGSDNFGDFKQSVNMKILPNAVVEKNLSKINIDGKLDEWGNVNNFPIEINKTHQVKIGNPYLQSYVNVGGKELIDWKGTEDLSLKAKLFYDDTHLYIAIRGYDDRIVNQGRSNGANSFETGDCVEIFLDAREEKDQGKEKYDSKIFHLSFVPPSKDFPASTIYIHNPKGKKPGGMPVDFLYGLTVQTVPVKDGFVMEIKIPLRNFFKVKDGMVVGFDITISDLDDINKKKRKTSMVWAGSKENYKNASKFGKIIFKGTKN